MIRKSIVILLSIATLSSLAEAKPHKGKGFLKSLLEDVELTAEQKEMLKEMKQEAKENRSDRKERKGKGKITWMEDYASGEKSEREVLNEITERFDSKIEMKLEKTENILDFIDTLSTEQREQAIENIEESEERPQRKKRNGKGFGKKSDKLFSGIDLSSRQETQLEKLQELLESRRENKQKQPRKGWMMQALNDEASDREILNDIKDRIDDHEDFRLRVAEAWMDIIDSLDRTQKQQFVENLQAIKTKKQQRKEKRREQQR